MSEACDLLILVTQIHSLSNNLKSPWGWSTWYAHHPALSDFTSKPKKDEWGMSCCCLFLISEVNPYQTLQHLMQRYEVSPYISNCCLSKVFISSFLLFPFFMSFHSPGDKRKVSSNQDTYRVFWVCFTGMIGPDFWLLQWKPDKRENQIRGTNLRKRIFMMQMTLVKRERF